MELITLSRGAVKKYQIMEYRNGLKASTVPAQTHWQAPVQKGSQMKPKKTKITKNPFYNQISHHYGLGKSST